MKLKFLTILLVLVCLALNTNAQDKFKFQNLLRDTVLLEIDQSEVGSHYLGNNLAIKYYRLKETYTYLERGSDADPTSRTVVVKPSIYYSLKKLNNNYKKLLKKGEIDSIAASEKLGWYFDIGFAIYEQNTSSFEEALKEAKNPDRIEDVFARVILE